MAANDFLPVAIAGGANVASQSAYAASGDVSTGFANGESPASNIFNKMIRQSSTIANMLAAFLATSVGIAMNDDGNTAAKLAAMNAAFRIKLQANTTLHVSATGNDTTGNGSSGAPWATFAHAIAVVQQTIDTNGFTITLKWDTAGNLLENVSISGPQVGVTNPNQFIFDFGSRTQAITSGNSFTADNGALCTLQNVTMTNSGGGAGVVSNNRSYVLLGAGITFGTFASAGIHMLAQLSGQITCTTSYSITGGAGSHYNANTLGIITVIAGITVTLTGTPAFAIAFASLSSSGFIGATSITYTGSATGVRYNAVLNSVAFTQGGASYFPGNSAGTTATGGQYA